MLYVLFELNILIWENSSNILIWENSSYLLIFAYDPAGTGLTEPQQQPGTG